VIEFAAADQTDVQLATHALREAHNTFGTQSRSGTGKESRLTIVRACSVSS